MRKSDLQAMQASFTTRSRFIQRASMQSLRRETSAAQGQRIRQLLRPKRYGAFFEYYFGHNMPGALGTARVAPFHVSAYQELYQKDLITQFRFWFRGAAKSTQTGVGNAFALKCCQKLKFMLLVAINQWRARLLLADLQAQLSANARIIQDFGEQRIYGKWSDGMFETKDGCFFMALGLNQPFRGLKRYAERVDYVVVDDIEDSKRAKNPQLVQEYTDKILGDIGAIFHKDRQRMVIANNYTIANGVLAALLKRSQHNPYVSVSKVPLATPQGTPTWPHQYDRKRIARIHKKYDYYTLQREYYNRPLVQGRLIQSEWIRFAAVPDTPLHLVGHWDLSYADTGDYKAFALVAHTQGRFVVLDVFCRRCALQEAVRWHYERLPTHLKKYGQAHYSYEANAGQGYVFGPMFAEVGQACGEAPPMPYRSPSQPKAQRIEETLKPLFFHGQLFFADALQDNPDAELAIQQLLSFDRGQHAPDDFPDALQVALHTCRESLQTARLYQKPLIGQRHPSSGY